MGGGNAAREPVQFLLDTGAPATFMANTAADIICGGSRVDDQLFKAVINGVTLAVHQTPESCHFSGLNILGYDFSCRDSY